MLLHDYHFLSSSAYDKLSLSSDALPVVSVTDLALSLRSNTTPRITRTAASTKGPIVQRAMHPLIEPIIPPPIMPPIIEGIIHMPRTHKTRTAAATNSTIATMLCALLIDIYPPHSFQRLTTSFFSADS